MVSEKLKDYLLKIENGDIKLVPYPVNFKKEFDDFEAKIKKELCKKRGLK